MDKAQWQLSKDIFYKIADLPQQEQEKLLLSQTQDQEIISMVKQMLEQDQYGMTQVNNAVVSSVENVINSNFDLPAGSRVGAFKITKLLGKGGMGAVYLGERDDAEFRQLVAIKIIHKHLLTEQLLEQFKQERQILADLNHPNIANLLDGGTVNDQSEHPIPYLVMEYIEGQPLIEYCRSHNLPLEPRLTLFLNVCDAIEYAHQHLIIHRDIKPSNVIVDSQGRAKILDFGIARILNNSTTEVSSPDHKVLSLECAAPEQIKGNTVTTATDVYGLGTLLYQLLTECPPFIDSKSSRDKTLERICHSPLTPPSKIENDNLSSAAFKFVSKLKGDLDAIVIKAMNKEPNQRYTTVTELRQDVKNFLLRYPVAAKKPTIGYRLTRYLQRNAIVSALTILIVISLGVFSATLYKQSIALEKQRVAAVEEAQISGSMNDFLLSIFDSADPMENSGEKLSALDLLEKAGTDIKNMESTNTVKMRLLNAIASANVNLNQTEQARGLLREAQALVDKSESPQVIMQANLWINWANIFLQQGEYESAIEKAQQTIELLEHEFSQKDTSIRNEDMLELLRSALASKATTHSELRQNQIALEDGRKHMQVTKQLYSNDSKEIADAHALLAHLERRVDNLQAATEHMKIALPIFKRVKGANDLEYGLALNQQARNLFKLERYEEALPLTQESIEVIRHNFEEPTPEEAASLGNQSSILAALGRFEEAIEARQKVFDILVATVGANHPYVGITLSSQAKIYEQAGDSDIAVEYFNKSIKVFDDIGENADYYKADAYLNLGEVYVAQEQYERALETFLKSYEIANSHFSGPDRRIALSASHIGDTYWTLEQPELAKQYWQRALEVYKESSPSDEQTILELQSKLSQIAP
ncbi:protein kinase domain-containing protein [Glaciecola sp. 1036]|uniref:protein kinase domain-containing protein n=1 Tax=Alteromonadaceae TaxID=72275 RepID=UPI003D00C016